MGQGLALRFLSTSSFLSKLPQVLCQVVNDCTRHLFSRGALSLKGLRGEPFCKREECHSNNHPLISLLAEKFFFLSWVLPWSEVHLQVKTSLLVSLNSLTWCQVGLILWKTRRNTFFCPCATHSPGLLSPGSIWVAFQWFVHKHFKSNSYILILMWLEIYMTHVIYVWYVISQMYLLPFYRTNQPQDFMDDIA